MPALSSEEIVRHAVEAALAKKAEDLVVMDLRGIFDVTDFFVVATGSSDRQVEAIADAVEDATRAAGSKPMNVEGRERMHWVLLDYVDVVVHVMHPDERMKYQLERLWGEAGLVRYDEEGKVVHERPARAPGDAPGAGEVEA